MRSILCAFLMVLAAAVVSPTAGHAADFQKGYEAYQNKDYATALREWIPLAEQGNVSAQTNLGIMHQKGQGVTKNNITAIKWYRLAADQGHGLALAKLGYMYNKGQGVPQDDKTSFKWYRLAAEQGHVLAQNVLGTMYTNEIGVPQDYIHAYKWFNLSASKGHKTAIKNLRKIEKIMSSAQLAKAKKLVAAWKPASPVVVSKKTQPPALTPPKMFSTTIPAPSKTVVSGTTFAEKRIALVIGNGVYQHPTTLPSLKNPPNDARGIAATLSKLGFELIGGGVQLNLDRVGMEDAIIEFGERLGDGTVGLFYYAGHGLAVNKTNYLIPVDTDKLTKKTVNIKMVSADLVMDQFPKNGGMNIMILDACRNTPASLRGVRGNENEGLVQMNAPSGTLISYATQPGNVALDGTGNNSPYATALMKMMQQPGVGVLEVFNDVGVEVERITDGFQRPWINSSPLEGKFYFKGRVVNVAAPVQPTQTQPTMTADMMAWQSIQNSTNPEEIEAFILAFHSSPFSGMARARLKALKEQQVALMVAPKSSPPPSAAPGPSADTVNWQSVQYSSNLAIRDLGTLPDEIRVIHTPNPVRAQRGGQSGKKYTWRYKTTVESKNIPLVIHEFAAFHFVNEEWVFSNYTGKPFTQADFAEWYSCPNANLELGGSCSDPVNWGGGDQLTSSKTLWLYIGRDFAGKVYKGHAIIERLGEIDPTK